MVPGADGVLLDMTHSELPTCASGSTPGIVLVAIDSGSSVFGGIVLQLSANSPAGTHGKLMRRVGNALVRDRLRTQRRKDRQNDESMKSAFLGCAPTMTNWCLTFDTSYGSGWGGNFPASVYRGVFYSTVLFGLVLYQE